MGDNEVADDDDDDVRGASTTNVRAHGPDIIMHYDDDVDDGAVAEYATVGDDRANMSDSRRQADDSFEEFSEPELPTAAGSHYSDISDRPRSRLVRSTVLARMNDVCCTIR